MSNYDTFQFLNSLLQFGWRLGLDAITGLLQQMGNPYLEFKSVHIAGTNGKGSTAAMLESMFRAGGFKTGLYTSPHLVEVTERIKVNGADIPKTLLAHYLERNRERMQRINCTYFEALTAIAFQYFADEQVDLAFIEVGLGGRFDATNVIVPQVSLITEIDLDHTDHLGRTIAQITKEKAGIIKAAVPCLSGSNKKKVNEVLRAACANQSAPFYVTKEICQIRNLRSSETDSEFDLIFAGRRFNNLKLSLTGDHQIKNAALAVSAAEVLRTQNIFLEEQALHRGLQAVAWPARLQKLQDSPKVIIDVAHNPAGIRALLRSLQQYENDRLILVIGLLRDKDYQAISKLIAKHADFIAVVTPSSERALPAEEFARALARYTSRWAVFTKVERAFEKATHVARETDLICVTGSHYLVGDFLKFYKKA